MTGPKIFDVTDIEQAAAESEQDRRDHGKLRRQVAELMKHDDMIRVPSATRRLVDGGIDPVVIAKTFLIGSRDGSFMYRTSARALALDEHEAVTELYTQVAIRDSNPDLAATMLIAGATWLATQFAIDREMLAAMVTSALHRPRHPERAGYGAVDFIDSHGVGNRAQIVESINLAQLPSFAPLEYTPS